MLCVDAQFCKIPYDKTPYSWKTVWWKPKFAWELNSHIYLNILNLDFGCLSWSLWNWHICIATILVVNKNEKGICCGYSVHLLRWPCEFTFSYLCHHNRSCWQIKIHVQSEQTDVLKIWDRCVLFIKCYKQCVVRRFMF